MKKQCYLLFFVLLIGFVSNCKADELAYEMAILSQWQAGESVSRESVKRFGIDKCFVSCEIDDKLFSRIKGLSYKDDCNVPLSELMYIKVLHYNIDQEILLGEMICNRAIIDDLLDIFEILYNNRYPIERMVLIDNYGANDNESMVDNNSSSFNFRYIAGTKKLSNHSLGLAVDINPLYNPYIRYRDSEVIVDPIEATPYVDRTKAFLYKVDKGDLCYEEFLRHGFEWGGNWATVKDYQHFEKSID